MIRSLGILVVSLLVVPIVALGLARSIHGALVSPDGSARTWSQLGEDIESCNPSLAAVAPDREYACSMVQGAATMATWALALLIAGPALLLGYSAAAFGLSQSRAHLAQFFPWIVRASLIALIVLLLAQGALLMFMVYEMANAGRGSHIMWAMVLTGAGFFVAATLIVSSWRRLLEPESLPITGIVLDPRQMPALQDRIQRLARTLNAQPPARIIVGLEPTAFVTSAEINLRGTGLLSRAETLYLPAIGIRALSSTELDAVIGHELGHFRGDDLRYSERFVPAFRSLNLSLESVSTGGEDGNAWLQLARLPAISMLDWMIYLLNRVVARISREREFAADRAAVEASSAGAIAGSLVKFALLGAEWAPFRQGVGRYVSLGHARRNLNADYLARTKQMLVELDPKKISAPLLACKAPHPLDSHPPISARVAALGFNAETVIPSCLQSLIALGPATDEMDALELQLSQLQSDELRVPGHLLTLDTDDALPAELSRTAHPV